MIDEGVTHKIKLRWLNEGVIVVHPNLSGGKDERSIPFLPLVLLF